MKIIRYTLLRRPWHLPPHDLARGGRLARSCDATERPSRAFPPPGCFSGPLAQPRESFATKTEDRLSAARP
jgi:hypothetical protein